MKNNADLHDLFGNNYSGVRRRPSADPEGCCSEVKAGVEGHGIAAVLQRPM